MFTPEQREQIDEKGYLIVENALEPFGLERVRAAYEDIQRQTEAGMGRVRAQWYIQGRLRQRSGRAHDGRHP